MRVVFVPGEQLRSRGTRSKISNMREWKRLLGGDVRERRHEPWVRNHDEVRRRDEETYDDIARKVQEAKNAAEAQAADDRTVREAVPCHVPDHVLRGASVNPSVDAEAELHADRGCKRHLDSGTQATASVRSVGGG